jgi:hypothetical protein
MNNPYPAKIEQILASDAGPSEQLKQVLAAFEVLPETARSAFVGALALDAISQRLAILWLEAGFVN